MLTAVYTGKFLFLWIISDILAVCQNMLYE